MIMCETDKTINWEKIINLYNYVKNLYALCEEVDPELNTNLQPLNEFRAALDHLMRISAIVNLEEYSEYDAVEESKSLYGHLKRAYFDICDMVTIHYRNRIVDILSKYEKDEIQSAIPSYYSGIRPELEAASENIAIFRTENRFSKNRNDIEEYYQLIEKLGEYYNTVLHAEPSLMDLKAERLKKENKELKKEKKDKIIIPIVCAVIGAVGGAVLNYLIGLI